MKRYVTLLALAAAALAGCTKVAKPNLVVVVVDSLRADALGCYGGRPGATPNMDRLAGEGARFERAVAQAPWNLPSVSSLITSAYPWQHGQGVLGAKAGDVTTLAEVLSKNGYRTAAFTEAGWPLLERGFSTVRNTAAPTLYGDPDSNSAAKTVAAALEWIRRPGDGPFFVLIHTYEAHSYFLGKPKHREFARRERPSYQGHFADWAVRDTSKPAGTQVIDALLGASADDLDYVQSLYRGAVAETDAEIGRLAAGLQQAGVDKDTVLVLTSSNGEGFRPDLGRVHHAGRLHDDLLHVPLIVRWPGRLSPSVSRSLVESLDVAPTLLALLGRPAEPRFAGRQLVAAETGLMSRFRGPRFALAEVQPKPALAEESTFRTLPTGRREAAAGRQLALYSDWITLIDTGERVELYDLKTDPKQERDVSQKYADVAKGLREELKRRTGGAARAAAPDDAAMEQLRSLGYVQ
jgi:arylsulfatase A-like enzyme